MTPAARYAAAIVVLDRIVAGAPAEKSLTTWARTNRFAGSGDRAAVRDHVYDALRARRTLAAMGGSDTGRGLVLGLLRRAGIDPALIFGAGGYAPSALTGAESEPAERPLTPAQAADLPDWLWPIWQESLGDDAMGAADCLRDRAGVFLRVNRNRTRRDEAQASLAAEGIATVPVPDVKTALQVTDNPRKVATSKAFRDGLIEVQDTASQIAISRLPLAPDMRVLDYCAGGGGKALAMADLLAAPVWAHDIDTARMADIAPRAARAGSTIRVFNTSHLPKTATFDLVLCDAPCSGSGTWRRAPDAKWRITPGRLTDLVALQQDVLTAAARQVVPGGVLAYATCSVLNQENRGAIDAFCRNHRNWDLRDELVLHPQATHDGFYLAILRDIGRSGLS